MCLIRRRILNALSEQPTRPETYFEMTKKRGENWCGSFRTHFIQEFRLSDCEEYIWRFLAAKEKFRQFANTKN